MVIGVFPLVEGTTGPRFVLLKLYSFFILLLIKFSFTRCSFSRRNDSYDHPAKCINDNQDSTEKIPADSDEPILACLSSLDRECEFIFKDPNSIRKPDTMLLKVRLGFVGIPFE